MRVMPYPNDRTDILGVLSAFPQNLINSLLDIQTRDDGFDCFECGRAKVPIVLARSEIKHYLLSGGMF